jgi:hypothetical protein
MAKKSIRERLEKLERERRFLEWFVLHRFCTTLTTEELETWATGRGLPDPVPNRPSSLDTLDRKSLRRLGEEQNPIFEGRSQQETEFYVENGAWPEQTGRLHYFLQDGRLNVEWRIEAKDENIRFGTAT